ncbi:hypothetical protein CO115_04000 [Candidatus Falkowbacteria bacterium CG_4_9_14_3_um_filter_36_9]|uniref:Uncharacterized protein n=2 Tax=Candidatus Falkowiibacteriota TaxID=1752728 RepID=A0A1J4TBM0_9BACT|nr:MAG: hypothetical protein AUJ27_01660 [Candidatus Falkowbacteria bacterium CG1_02_37_44]PIV51374.1 MAG: hypothetical protein COS18_02870 [Candidatus Falkowbacteria bacterium CG02_land_8_20_14_3_00_36_14]PIX11102.1 MAG: hypothetical protein COZ73_03575 [Candidatus Falkowbacteria bacterium CG_4_8_14_3_um_filter_36_11]PJA10289.1 MAG: hypothetical protein COX67_04915 [Candidatus Falkowbacteria bacterium CG_4_10_14_0_2_um_filter_36_22]PJB18651.1 MAG: hypothetical protein CO115_04000 [Candidatus F
MIILNIKFKPLNKKENGMYYQEKVKFYREIFHLDKDPHIASQCCPGDPRDLTRCNGSGTQKVQETLDKGTPIVLENFGRRVDYTGGRAYDTIMLYVPGEKIDLELLAIMEERAESNLIQCKIRY